MKKYDIILFGGGIAGLWLLNILSDRGFSVLLVEKDSVGGVQTLGSQGMIHGGQRYLLKRKPDAHAVHLASMPERWYASLAGRGEIDLRDVRVLADHQVMWPAGGLLARASLMGAAHRIKTRMKKIERVEHPKVFAADRFPGSVYQLPEKVLDMHSLVSVLAERYRDRIRKGEVSAIDKDGHLDISGIPVEAQLVISVAGLGNEDTLRLLGVGEELQQRRPLRQIMVRTLEHPLYGHGIERRPSPRVTISSYANPSGGYIWYLGGALAIRSASLTEEEAIKLAKKEMKTLFRHIDWSKKEWATWYGVRAEPRDPRGWLPDGPVIQEYGKVFVAWPTKFTLVPMLSDQVLARIREMNMEPKYTDELPELPVPELATTPWDQATWFT